MHTEAYCLDIAKKNGAAGGAGERDGDGGGGGLAAAGSAGRRRGRGRGHGVSFVSGQSSRDRAAPGVGSPCARPPCGSRSGAGAGAGAPRSSTAATNTTDVPGGGGLGLGRSHAEEDVLCNCRPCGLLPCGESGAALRSFVLLGGVASSQPCCSAFRCLPCPRALRWGWGTHRMTNRLCASRMWAPSSATFKPIPLAGSGASALSIALSSFASIVHCCWVCVCMVCVVCVYGSVLLLCGPTALWKCMMWSR